MLDACAQELYSSLFVCMLATTLVLLTMCVQQIELSGYSYTVASYSYPSSLR